MRYLILIIVALTPFNLNAQKQAIQLGLGMNNIDVGNGSLGLSASSKYLYQANKIFVVGAEASYNMNFLFLSQLDAKSRVYSGLYGVYYADSNVHIRLLSGLSFIEGNYVEEYIEPHNYGPIVKRRERNYNSWSIPLEAQVFMNLNGTGSGLVLSFARHISTKRPFNVVTLAYQFPLNFKKIKKPEL